MLATSLLVLALSAASSDVAVTVTDPSGGRIPGATVVMDPDAKGAVPVVTGPRGEALL